MTPSCNGLFRLAQVTPEGVQWHLRRNCAVSPAQMCWMFVGLGLVSLGIAGFFWVNGATLVLPFALIEVVALSVALVAHAKHAADAEKISLVDGSLVVETEAGGQSSKTVFNRIWVRVGTSRRSHDLVELSGFGQKVVIGRHLRPELRGQLATELRCALQTHGTG